MEVGMDSSFDCWRCKTRIITDDEEGSCPRCEAYFGPLAELAQMVDEALGVAEPPKPRRLRDTFHLPWWAWADELMHMFTPRLIRGRLHFYCNWVDDRFCRGM
jgi:hypothetical protein